MNKVYFTYILFVFLSLFCGRAEAQLLAGSYPDGTAPYVPSSPKYELRAVWLTTIGGIDWPHSYNAGAQKEELCRTLDQLKAVGINTVFLQTRIRATTIFPSVLEPWDGCITGTPGRSPSYDPLRMTIEECHRRGMQLHAWVVTIPVGKWNKYGCKVLRSKYPKMLTKIGDEGYMNPERPETADYLVRICREIAENYDVDGIHLDYIRYPETWKLRVSRAEGRANITRIVRKIHDAVKGAKPWLMLSCSPIGKHDNLSRYSSNGWNARTRVCQDAQQWLREGLMDALFPMMYFRDNNFFPFAIDWAERSYGKQVAAGLGIYFLDPREGRWVLDDVARQMFISRELGLGHCFFRSKFLISNVKGIYDFTKNFNSIPALVPPMTWLSDERPAAPVWIEMADSLTLSWQRSADGNVYNVYASNRYPVDTDNPANLVATRLTENRLLVDVRPGLHYAVTVQNRYGLESEACQLSGGRSAVAASKPSALPIPVVDKSVDLPEKPSTLDAYYLVVETLQGRTVRVVPFKGKTLNVSLLPDGVYQWRSLGKKGRNHRLGFFAVKHKEK